MEIPDSSHTVGYKESGSQSVRALPYSECFGMYCMCIWVTVISHLGPVIDTVWLHSVL